MSTLPTMSLSNVGRLALVAAIAWFRLPVDGPIDAATSPGAESTTIRGATIIDGTGAPPVTADLRIEGDRIVTVGRVEPGAGDRIVEAAGLVLAPGFIDTHSHADADLLSHPDARLAISQGITTVVGGADGTSPQPLTTFLAQVADTPVAVNLAVWGGHNTYRELVMSDDFRRPATAAEIDAMQRLLAADMEAGALGLSTGLEYDPGIFSTTDEVVALAREAARHGGRYTSHLRSEDRTFWQAVEEILEIGRRAEIPVNLTHLKLAMRSSHGKAETLLARLDRARADGIDVTADIYPYTYWQSTLTVLFPERDFDNLESARFAVTEVSTADDMRLARYDPEPSLAGKTLAEIAAERGAEPAAVLIDLIRRAQEFAAAAGQEDVESVLGVSMAEADIERLVQWPFINICTDGELWGEHPRGAGSFTRVLGRYVRERGVLPLEAAIHRMTDRAARSAGIQGRGRLEPGAFADLVLFDPATVLDRATVEAPHRLSTGIVAVWVNGRAVWKDGAPTEARPGRVVRRGAVEGDRQQETSGTRRMRG